MLTFLVRGRAEHTAPLSESQAPGSARVDLEHRRYPLLPTSSSTPTTGGERRARAGRDREPQIGYRVDAEPLAKQLPRRS